MKKVFFEKQAKLLKSFWQNTSGTTSIEYVMVASGIALVIITAIYNVGNPVVGYFTAMLRVF